MSQKQSSVPFLPGNSFLDGQFCNQRRGHSLKYINGYPVVLPEPLSIGGSPHLLTTIQKPIDDELSKTKEKLTDATLMFQKSSTTKVEAPEEKIPAHIAYDKVAMRFFGFFHEQIPESSDEKERLHFVTINYFLEDDSLNVFEPFQKNSGLPQGTIIRRQCIPKNKQEFFEMEDFNVGIDVVLFGRTFHIYDCDNFTRSFYAQSGIELNPSEEPPQDSYAHKRQQIESCPKTPKAKSPAKEQLRAYLEKSGKTKELRFYCLWDGTDSLYGERRLFALHYDLIDNTIEIREKFSPNSGRDPNPIFLSRRRLLKNPQDFLHVDHAKDDDYYTDKDILIGESIMVLGRLLFVFDADPSTKQYYHETYGITFDSMQKKEVNEVEQMPVERTIPPYTGFGDEEDSLSCVESLEARPPRRNFKQLDEMAGKFLSFRAKLDDSSIPENKDRQFVVTYYLADDTVGVYEVPLRNSGIIGGKFLERTRVKNPTRSLPNAKTISEIKNQYYCMHDFYAGAKLCILSWKFVLLGTTPFAARFMEERPDVFPYCDIDGIVERMRQRLGPDLNPSQLFSQFDCDNSGKLDHEEFRKGLLSIDSALLEQEILTLLRRYDIDDDGTISYKEFVNMLK